VVTLALKPLDQTLRHLQTRVEAALNKRLPEGVAPKELPSAMRYATLSSGKRIRAGLVYAAGMTLGVDETALDAQAAAVELIHSYSLVHDDLPCMDDDDLRRGQPSCHIAYGEATALLTGDALQSLAFSILACDPEIRVSPTRRLRMITTLAQAAGLEGMAGGQATDLESVGKVLSVAQLEDMHARKTGSLIRAAVRLGALSSEDADEETLNQLDDYARAVGLAFQIADDILDIEEDTEILGKIKGADRIRNKPTYPGLLGMPAAKSKIQDLRDLALASIQPLGDNTGLLRQIADFITERTR
jgi:farnesyl diphosphate synthase